MPVDPHLPIGGTFEYEGVTLKLKRGSCSDGCYFLSGPDCKNLRHDGKIPFCVCAGADGKTLDNVYFIPVEQDAKTPPVDSAAPKPTPVPQDPATILLTEAISILGGARQQAYGKAEELFPQIAEFWRVYLRQRFGVEVPLESWDVTLMMDFLKTVRIINCPTHRDSWVDKAGYVGCGWRCVGGK